MSDEQDVPEPKPGEPISEAQHAKFCWGVPISKERQDWLRGLADRQGNWAAKPEATRGESAFKGVRLTGADVFWLVAYSFAGPGDGVGAKLRHLKEASARTLWFESLDAPSVHLEGADLSRANLREATLNWAYLTGAYLRESDLSQAHLDGADLRGAKLVKSDLTRANLQAALLDDSVLVESQLQGANLTYAQMRSASLHGAHLEGATLARTTINDQTDLSQVSLDIYTSMRDIRWGGIGSVDLTRIEWQGIGKLGDETRIKKGAAAEHYDQAARAYRQVAAQLRAQGMSEVADRFAYRAQVLQRAVLRRQRRYTRWLFSGFLSALAGYGYRPEFTLGWYMLLLLISIAVYCWQGSVFAHVGTPGLTILGTSVVDAFTALHGRGFFPTPAESGWQMGTAAFDAVAGLIIEASFIATFTQRFFAR